MRWFTVGLVGALLLLAACSDSPDSPTSAANASATASPADAVDDLAPLWERPLVASGTVYAVSQGHWLATGTFDNSAGTTNPTPNIQLDYGVGDAETGQVVAVSPLNGLPNAVDAVPGTDLFVAVAGDQVGVLDPSQGTFLWKRRTIGTEVVAMSSTHIWMGHTTKDGAPVCLTVDAGKLVKHDPACAGTEINSENVVDGVVLRPNSISVDLPTSELVPDFDDDDITIPVTRASDEVTSEPLWSHGDVSIRYENDSTTFVTSTFAKTDLGFVRIDYSHAGAPSEQFGERLWPDDVELSLIDARTGKVQRSLGHVPGGTLVSFAGDIAIFEQPDAAAGKKAVGYRVLS